MQSHDDFYYFSIEMTESSSIEICRLLKATQVICYILIEKYIQNTYNFFPEQQLDMATQVQFVPLSVINNTNVWFKKNGLIVLYDTNYIIAAFNEDLSI